MKPMPHAIAPAGLSLLLLKFSLFTIPLNLGIFWLVLESRFRAEDQTNAYILVGAGLLTALITNAVGVYILFGRPLNALMAKIHHNSSLDEFTPIPLEGKGEFATLTRSFNAMQARQYQSSRRLKRAHDALSEIYGATPTLIMTLNVDGQITHASSFWQETTGYRLKELIGLPFIQLLDLRSASLFTRQILPILISAGQVRDISLRLKCRNGVEMDIMFSAVARSREADSGQAGSKWLFCAMSDVTLLKRAEQQLRQVAVTDPLTGLANRADLTRYMNDLFADGSLFAERAAVLFIDIDNFKTINDTYGHSAGDKVLAEIAQRLQDNLRTMDYIARIGGDEFAVVCRNVKTDMGASLAAARLIACLKTPIDLGLGDIQGFVSASIGVAMVSEATPSPGKALEMADAAMYQAKKSGRNTYTFWDKSLKLSPSPSLKALVSPDP